MNRYLISRMRGRIFSFLLQEEKAVEIHCDDASAASLLGSIYIGRVKNIAANIGAAFVETKPGSVCYLPLSDLTQPVYTKKGSSPSLQQGDELLVQISRENIKSKYPSVTTNLTFRGKYVLLTAGKTQIHVSSKLSKEEKRQLTALAKELEAQLPLSAVRADGSRAFGWLLRTNAAGADPALLLADMQRLAGQYQKLLAAAQHRPCYSCLLSNPAPWLARLSNLYHMEELQILTEEADIFEAAQNYLAVCQPEDLHRLLLYQDRLQPLVKHFSLERHLSQALSERVWLSSGGYLVIQPTEALTVIDVNTGKFEGGKNREKAFLKINKEAALEAARQIRLRNLGGIILIDFINMESEDSVQTLLSLLDAELKKDPVPAVLVDMTKLSLVEITRMKREKPLAQACQEIS